MPRYFTLAQAEAMLPAVGGAVRDAVALRNELAQAEQELANVAQRITMLGGSLVQPDRLVALKRRRDEAPELLKRAIERIHGYGCLLKDLGIGLVDFPTLYRGEEVYLCWKLDEQGIGFWHGVDEGFGGRKQIDRDFLDHHQGDQAN